MGPPNSCACNSTRPDNSVSTLGQHFVFRCRDQDHLGIQAFCQVQVDPCGIAGAAGRDHAFDHQHILADRSLLIQGDDFFQQLVKLTVAEHPLDVGQAQWLRRFQTMGTHQLGRAFRAGITRMRLGDGLEETDLQAGAFQRPNQPEADRGQTHTEIGGRDKESLHA